MKNWVLGLTSLGSLMVSLDALVVATALKTIRHDLGASLAQLEWVVNAYALTFAVLLVSGAALGDRYGRRRVFAAGLSLFTLASVGCALAPDVGWLIAARAAQGAGSALVMPLAMALLAATFPAAERGRALGLFSGVTGLGVLGGPVLGGVVTQGLDWPWIFWINVPLGLLAVPLALRRIPESRGAAEPLDPIGLLLLSAGALGLVWALIGLSWPGLVLGVAAVAAFLAWESRRAAPLLPLGYFRLRAFSFGNLSGFLLYGGLYGAVFFLSQFLQSGLGYGPLEAGLRLLPWTGTLFVVAPIAGSLVDRFGERPLLVAGMLLQAVGMGWIALDPGVPYSSMVAPLVIAGLGVSMAMPAAQNAVIGAVPVTAIGKASGTFNMLRQLGGAFGVATMSLAFSAAGGYQTFVAASPPALAVCAAISLGSALSAAFLPARRRTPVAQPAATR